jgi:uncharacterized membrane protein YebE (DUF533 family)
MTMAEEFLPEIDIREDQAEAIARGLYAVARADGNVHEREAAMISEFFNTTTDHPSHMAALERQPVLEPANLAAILSTPELRRRPSRSPTTRRRAASTRPRSASSRRP